MRRNIYKLIYMVLMPVVILAICVNMIIDTFDIIEINQWPTVDAEVINLLETSSARTQKSPGATRETIVKYITKVEYSYIVDGEKYTSDMFSLLQSSVKTESLSDANNFRDNYKKGKSINIYYNPKNPSVSYIVIPSILSNIFNGILMIALCLLLIVFFIKDNQQDKSS